MSDGEISKLIASIFDMRPSAIESRLKLRNPIYLESAQYGNMGRIPEEKELTFYAGDGKKIKKTVETFTWEKLDFVEKIKKEFKI